MLDKVYEVPSTVPGMAEALTFSTARILNAVTEF